MAGTRCRMAMNSDLFKNGEQNFFFENECEMRCEEIPRQKLIIEMISLHQACDLQFVSKVKV